MVFKNQTKEALFQSLTGFLGWYIQQGRYAQTVRKRIAVIIS